MTTSTREQLLVKQERRIERVDLPEFGEDAYVMVHGMNAREKIEYEASLMTSRFEMDVGKQKTQKERMIICCARDDDGDRIFTDDDVAALGEWPVDPFNRVFDKALYLTGGYRSLKKAAKNSPEITPD